MSRNCTDEGWTDLEPGPYNKACGLEDQGPEEVGLGLPCPPGIVSTSPSLRPPGWGLPSPPRLLLQACIHGGLPRE